MGGVCVTKEEEERRENGADPRELGEQKPDCAALKTDID
jgi:hypothetical protein